MLTATAGKEVGTTVPPALAHTGTPPLDKYSPMGNTKRCPNQQRSLYRDNIHFFDA